MNFELFQSSDAVPEASRPSESALVLETGNGQIEPLECPPDEADFPVETTHTLFVHLSLHYLHAQDGNPHAKLYHHGDMLVTPTNTPLVVRWERDENCLRVQLSVTLLKQVAAEILGKADNRLRLVPTFQNRQQQLAAISTLLMAEAQQRKPSSKLYLDSLANVLAVQLLRNFHNYGKPPAQLPSYEGGLPTSQLNQMLDYIDAGVARTINLEPINVKVMRNAPLSTLGSKMSNVDQKLQAILDREIRKPHTYSLLLGVHSGDERIDFRGAAGEASPQSPYFVASISKMYTATVIMQLVDEGKLDLDDQIEPYLSHLSLEGIHVYEGRDFSNQLKVYQLLHQTSGLADYFEGRLAKDFKQNRDRSYSVEDVLDITRDASPFAAPDSGKSHYSDTNYQILGTLIEVLTEQSLAEAFQRRIFDRLELADTYLFDCNNPRSIEPLPFYFRDTCLSLPLAMTSERGAGGAVSTMADTLRFLRAYFDGEFFDKVHFSQIMQWNAMFFPMQYGYGLWRYKLPRWTNVFRETPEFIGHAGVCGAMAYYNPKNDLYIVGTLNQMYKPVRQFNLLPKVINAAT